MNFLRPHWIFCAWLTWLGLSAGSLDATESPARPHRLLADHDGHLLFSTLTTDYKADVDETVRELPANVTTYLVCCGAGRYYFPTKVGLVDPNLKQLIAEHAKGNDPLGYFLQRLRAAGKETFITFRMNDTHEPTARNQWNTPVVRMEHPDAIVGPEAAARNDPETMNWAMDYARPEVIAYVKAMLKEVVDRYGGTIDGLQLDWMRFPRHLSGQGDAIWAKRAELTHIVEAARAYTKAKGILLSVRVPSSPQGCRVLGVDVADWVQRGLVDFVTVSAFLETDYTMPIADFRTWFGRDIPIYASMESEHGWQFHNAESFRAAASSLYASGADGISLFNFTGMRGALGAVPWDWIAGLETPATAARKPLLFSVPPVRYRKDVDLRGFLPVKVAAHAQVNLPLFIPPLALPAWRARLLAIADGPLTVEWEGKKMEAITTLHPTELFAEFIRPTDPAGRRPKPEESRLYRFDPQWLRSGQNTMTLRNDSEKEVEVTRVNLGLW